MNILFPGMLLWLATNGDKFQAFFDRHLVIVTALRPGFNACMAIIGTRISQSFFLGYVQDWYSSYCPNRYSLCSCLIYVLCAYPG